MENPQNSEWKGDLASALVGGIALMLVGMLTGFIIGVRFEGFVLDASEWFRAMTVGTFLVGFVVTFILVRRKRARAETSSLCDSLPIERVPVRTIDFGLKEQTRKDAAMIAAAHSHLLPAHVAVADATEHLNNPPDAVTKLWRSLFGRRGKLLSRRGRNGLE